MIKAKAIMIQGTGSGVGKSVLVAALCRVFLQDGYKVCPFKAQNMALNSFVTKEQGEIGRAQATQAQACRIEPSIDMNPVLLKPNSDTGAQIIVHGQPIGNMSATSYIKHKKELKDVVRKSYQRLAAEYELVVIEGAGSPAEINLKSHDIVNMRMAFYARAPVILVGDIDKGGVFAWLVGTLELLSLKERKMVQGIIINKFRGDKSLLTPGIDFLERRTGIKVLGVLPYFRDIKIAEEDAIPLDTFKNNKPEGDGGQPNSRSHKLKRRDLTTISVLHLPHIANFTDFDYLEREPDVQLRYVSSPRELEGADVIIIPGTKNTIGDLAWLKSSGLAAGILSTLDQRPSTTLVGICGGYQMLGVRIRDRHSLESHIKEMNALGIVPIETDLEKEKILTQVKAREIASGLEISGYEIHHGNSRILNTCSPAFEIFERKGRAVRCFEGALIRQGRVLGTYIHGLFDNDGFRGNWLNRIRKRKGLPALVRELHLSPEREFDKLAQLVRENINLKFLYKILNREL